MTIGTLASSKNIIANGIRLHYLDWGNETAQPLLLLHGFSSHARTWDAFAQAMATSFHVIALDQRGHGDSEWTRKYGTEAMVADVDGFVQELGLSSFVLVGLSMGGSNAFNYAALHPEEVERLVVVDVGPTMPAPDPDRAGPVAETVDTFATKEDAFAQARLENSRPPVADHRERVYNGLMQTADGKWTWKYDKALRGRDGMAVRPRLAPEVLWQNWRSVRCPVLLVRGGISNVLSPETAERMLRENANCELVVVPGSGHSIPLEKPAEFEQVVKTWLLDKPGAGA